MLAIDVTLDVLNEERSRVCKLEHSVNIACIVVTLAVLKLDSELMVVRLLHLANMLAMFWTFDVLNVEGKVMVSKLVQPSKR